MSKVVLKSKAESKNRSPSRQKRPQSANNYASKPQAANQHQTIFQNTKVGANVNRGNVVNSPRGNVQFQGNYGNEKTNYLGQSTKVSVGNPTGYAGESSQEACSRYANSLKNALLDQSTRNPHFAT